MRAAFVLFVGPVLLLEVLRAHPTDYSLADQELTHPTEFVSSDGELDVDIAFGQFRYQGHANTGAFWTRAYNGNLPGPTIRFRAGDSVRVHFSNSLGPQPNNVVVHNAYHSPNTTNFHTHGLHVSPIAPADDVLLVIGPGEVYEYVFDIPDDHAPGTFWYHAHHHASVALHVGGGASGVMIVEDQPGDIPSVYTSMPEKILLLQEFPMAGPGDNLAIATASGDALTTVNNQMVNQDFILVNGYFQPRITMVQSKWYRFRVVFSGVFTPREITIAGCTLQLLAKDGVYLRDAPRPVTTAIPLAPGNRVDLAVLCAATGTFTVMGGAAKKKADQDAVDSPSQKQMGAPPPSNLATLVVEANTGTADGLDLPDVDFSFPSYLTDLTTLPPGVTPNQVVNNLNGAPGTCTVNGVPFPEDHSPAHTISVGTVQQWSLGGVNAHPFHIHVSPFQIFNIDANEYHQVGDWYDVLFTGTVNVRNPVVRFQTDRFTGHYVIHCHLLPHEDLGCMGLALVTGVEGTPAIVQASGSPSASPSPQQPSPSPSASPSQSYDQCTATSIALAGLAPLLAAHSGLELCL